MAEAAATGYPVLLKATGGGGGIGIYTCPDEAAVRANFEAAGRCARIPALALGNIVDPVPELGWPSLGHQGIFCMAPTGCLHGYPMSHSLPPTSLIGWRRTR